MKRLIIIMVFAHGFLSLAITPEQIDRLLIALEQVESGGEYWKTSDNGRAVGILQITPIMVRDVNRILGKRKYKLSDRLFPDKSWDMAHVYFTHYGKHWTTESAARHWNAGPNNTHGTDDYWEKVRREMYK